ncbi:MAG TPA: tRNA (adenosine(37)-N6)-threonylcarbamoyltransferase complex dimerization subunit type 1 TsaB [Longilinea sp.]|nr:tRNA (adenosine(37)-N6)-threonylcarbamoyltransferase complex dimerization subunit type 1 TsaB [Longilinea sp.]
MMLLAVDASTQSIGLALYDGVEVIGDITWKTNNHHTVELAPGILSLLKRSGIKPDSLKAFGVALGPGSFTSLRIGLAVVKGMALAQKLPVIGIPTLDYLAFPQPAMDMRMAAVLRAGRGRLAVGWYDYLDGNWHPKGETKVMTAAELAADIKAPTYICGELTADERQTLARKWKNTHLASPAQSLRRPAVLAEMAWKRWQDGQVDEVISLSPIYLHINEAIPD